MDADNNKICEQGFEDFFDEMYDFGEYSRDSEAEQNLSSSGTEDEPIGEHVTDQQPLETELLGSTSIVQTEDEIFRTYAPNQQEFFESDKPMWNDSGLTWPTFDSGTLDFPNLALWDGDPASMSIPAPNWDLSSPVNGFDNLHFMSNYGPGNILDGSTSSSVLDNYDMYRPHFTLSGMHPWTPVQPTPTNSMLTQHQCSREVPRLHSFPGSTINNSTDNGGSQAYSSAMADLQPMDSAVPFTSFDSRSLIPSNSFHGPDNLDPSIDQMDNLEDFGHSSIIEKSRKREYTWDHKDTFTRIVPSRSIVGDSSNSQASIPTAGKHSMLPRSHLTDEADAFSAADRALPSRAQSANVFSVQENGVPRFTHAINTHMISHEVESQFLASPSLPAFKVPGNQRKDPPRSHRTLAPAVQLHGTSSSVTQRSLASPIVKKTTQQGHFLTFESRPGASKKVSARSCFNPEKRSKVAGTRKKGACAACQVRKIECKEVPEVDACEHCIKIFIKKAGEALTMHNICVRHQLYGTRFEIIDFYYLDHRRGTLREYEGYYEMHKANATTTQLSIGHAPKFGVQKRLVVEVQKYPGNDFGDRLRFFKAGRVGGSNGSLYTTDHYMIVKRSLPTVEQLDLWGRELVQAKCALDPHSLTSGMDSMLLRYCAVNSNPRIAQILGPIMRIVSLNACRTRPPVNFEESVKRANDLSGNWSEQDRERGVDVSDEVLAQIVHIALSGIEEAEKYVLGNLDKLRKEMEIGRLEWVAIGVCLMRLLLVYRDLALRYVYGARKVGSGAGGNIDSRAKRAMLMYDTLTAVYGATFHKTTSPLSGQWHAEDHSDALCNDHILMKAMEALKFHYRLFCEGSEFEPEDAFFKTLIAVPMTQQGQQKQKQTAKDGPMIFKQEL